MLKNKKIFDYNGLYPLFFTVVFILIVIQYSFSTLDAIFYDLWVRIDITNSWSDRVVVVPMEEESDEFLGETYPYTYATHTRFLEKILQDQPLSIGYFTQLQNPEYQVEEKYFQVFKEQINQFIAKNGSFRFATQLDVWGEELPPEELREFGFSLGILNQDNLSFAKDDVVRRAILNISGEDSFHLYMANKLRSSVGELPVEPSSIWGSYYNREADAIFAMFRYATNTTSGNKIRSIPYHRVVVGNFPRGFFSNKIVIIGPQYLANSADFSFTPFNKDSQVAPKLNIHAQIIDALSRQKTIYEIPGLISDIIAILLALSLSFFISRVSPAKGLLMTITMLFSVFVLSFGLFVTFGLWLKLAHIILSIFVVYYIWVPFRAIGEYQTRYKFQEEAKLLKQVDNLKQNFISLMSHDLKTPVAKIQGIADILSIQYQNTEEQQKLLSNIILSTKELNGFISSILDLTKVESQNLQLNKSPKDVNKIIDDIVVRLKYEAGQKNMEIETELSPLYPIEVDVVLFNRIISNLIENAIKYAGENKTVSIKTWDDAEWVYIEIRDNGIGIKPEDLDHIFDKFYRVRNDSSHSIKGSGLGLYLVKYFIELHDGQIAAESEFGYGTKFTVKLKNK
jgi:signal transduction histidine kinase